VAAGEAFGVGRKLRELRRETRGQLAALHALDLVGELRKSLAVVGQARLPFGMQLLAARAEALAQMIHHAIGHQELGVLGPAIAALGQADLLLAKWFAMRGGGVLLVWCAVADMALTDDQRRTVLTAVEDLDRCIDMLEIIDVADPRDVPAVTEETRRHVLAEGEVGVAFDGHAVAVVEPAEIGQFEMSGNRGSLAGDAFHHVAVAADRINIVVEHRQIWPVEAAGKPALRDRHADAVAAALAERARCRLHAGGEVIFGMPGAFAAELAEALDVVERDARPPEAFVFGVDRLDAG